MNPWPHYSHWRDLPTRPRGRRNPLRALRGERLVPRRSQSPRARSAKPVYVAYQGAR